MNAYEYRKALRKKRQALHDEQRRLTKILEVDNLIRAYENAYQDLHGEHPKVMYKNGWYYCNGIRLRNGELRNETNRLMAALHERTINNPEG